MSALSALVEFNRRRVTHMAAVMPNASSSPLLLVDPAPGFCTGTDSAAADCRLHTKGSWRLRPEDVVTWEAAARACASLCSLCEGCRYVSISLKFNDCSWFTHCYGAGSATAASRSAVARKQKRRKLHRNPNGFITATMLRAPPPVTHDDLESLQARRRSAMATLLRATEDESGALRVSSQVAVMLPHLLIVLLLPIRDLLECIPLSTATRLIPHRPTPQAPARVDASGATRARRLDPAPCGWHTCGPKSPATLARRLL